VNICLFRIILDNFFIYFAAMNANAFKGDRLKAIRNHWGFTRAELAKLVQFAQPASIGHLESNRHRPTPEKEAKLCEVFKVESDYFRK